VPGGKGEGEGEKGDNEDEKEGKRKMKGEREVGSGGEKCYIHCVVSCALASRWPFSMRISIHGLAC
jgi:hypothetical protein